MGAARPSEPGIPATSALLAARCPFLRGVLVPSPVAAAERPATVVVRVGGGDAAPSDDVLSACGNDASCATHAMEGKGRAVEHSASQQADCGGRHHTIVCLDLKGAGSAQLEVDMAVRGSFKWTKGLWALGPDKAPAAAFTMAIIVQWIHSGVGAGAVPASMYPMAMLLADALDLEACVLASPSCLASPHLPPRLPSFGRLFCHSNLPSTLPPIFPCGPHSCPSARQRAPCQGCRVGRTRTRHAPPPRAHYLLQAFKTEMTLALAERVLRLNRRLCERFCAGDCVLARSGRRRAPPLGWRVHRARGCPRRRPC